MSNLIEQHTFLLADEIRKLNPALYAANVHLLTELISGEIAYRKSKGFPVAENRGEEEIRELIYRRGALKKLFESRLFLATRKKKDGFIAEQLIYSIE